MVKATKTAAPYGCIECIEALRVNPEGLKPITYGCCGLCATTPPQGKLFQLPQLSWGRDAQKHWSSKATANRPQATTRAQKIFKF